MNDHAESKQGELSGLAALLLQHAFEAVLLLDGAGPDGRIRYANATLVEWLGRPLDWLIGRTRADIEVGSTPHGAHHTRLLKRDGTFVDCRVRSIEIDGRHAVYYLLLPASAAAASPAWAMATERSGLHTLEHLLEALRRDWSIAQRTQAVVTLMHFQIDAFDPYVEVYGRASAESGLLRVGNVIAGALRRNGDVVARSGDAEFIALATSMDAERAPAHAEAILGRVRALALHHPRSPAARYLTACVGVVCAVPPAMAGHLTMLEAVTEALRQGQGEGGNRVAVGTLNLAP